MPVLKTKGLDSQIPLKVVNHNKNIYLCRFCNRNFQQDNLKQKHQKICTSKRKLEKRMLIGRFCCVNCDCSFKHKYNLKTHIKHYCNVKPEKCMMCKKICPNLRSLKYHIKKRHWE